MGNCFLTGYDITDSIVVALSTHHYIHSVEYFELRRNFVARRTGVSVVNTTFTACVRFLLSARANMSPSRKTNVFTRTLDGQVPAIYPHPRQKSTRNLPAPSLFLPAIYPHPRFLLPAIYPHPRLFFTRNLPAPSLFFTRNLPAPSLFFYPQFTRTRGTRRPSLPSHPRNPSPVHTRDPRAPCPRWAPCPWHPPPACYPHPPQYPHPCVFVPVAPAARHYPATRETLRPCIPATRAPRVPVGALCPWHPPPVATQPPAKPFARAYPRPARPVSPLVPRARGTRRPHATRTRHSTRTRAFSSPQCPSPVATQAPVPAPVPIPIAGLSTGGRRAELHLRRRKLCRRRRLRLHHGSIRGRRVAPRSITTVHHSRAKNLARQIGLH